MLSPGATNAASEPKMYSATYVENYLDTVENLPNDVQRFLSRIREIDLQYQGKNATVHLCAVAVRWSKYALFMLVSWLLLLLLSFSQCI